MQVNGTWTPTIVAFCCNWCSYAGADLSGTNRLSYPANVKIIRRFWSNDPNTLMTSSILSTSMVFSIICCSPFPGRRPKL